MPSNEPNNAPSTIQSDLEPVTPWEAWCAISKISAPLYLRSLSMAAQVIAKRIILAKKDQQFIEAFSGLAAIEDFIFVFALPSIGYISLRVSQVEGEQDSDPKKVGAVFRSGLLFVGGQILIIGAVCLSAPLIYRMTQQPDIVIQNSGPYFQTAFFAYSLDFTYRAFVRLIIGLSKPMLPTIADIWEGVLDVSLTYYLVMNPNSHVSDTALAYAIAAGMTLIPFVLYIARLEDLKKYELFQFSNGIVDFRKIMTKGVHIGLSASVEYITQFLVLMYCGLSGPIALLAAQTAATISIVNSFLVAAIYEGGGIKTAYYYEKKNVAYRSFGDMTIIASALHAGACLLPICFFTEQLAGLMIHRNLLSDDEYQMILYFMRIQSVIDVFNTLKLSSAGVLSACNETGYSFSMSLIWIFFLNSLVVTVLQFVFNAHVSTMYTMQLIGIACTSAATLIGWRQWNKEPTNILERYYQKGRRYLNTFWEHAPVKFKLESPRHPEVDLELRDPSLLRCVP